MQGRIRKQTKYLTVSAMLSALGVVFLMLGSLVEVLDISVAVLASLLTVYAVIEMGRAYPWLIWIVTSVLSLLLLPQKTPALFYALFAGFYPILKEKLERIPSFVCYLLKLVVFHLCLGAMVAVMLLFIPDALEMNGMKWLPIALYLAALACFVLYDFALTKIITYYLIRLRKRFGIK
ncbi:MAG: hypothetical protein J6B71_03870 [Clostridia bacterium]|nr:hypothetical protein [Clostridia bacterium]